MAFDLFGVVIVLFRVFGSQFGAIPGNQFTANQIKVFGYAPSLPKNLLYGVGIVLSETGNGIVIRNQAFKEPH